MIRHMQNKKSTYITLFALSFIIGLLVPFISNAQIILTEIMYDPPGADSKREWVEVFNEGESDIDLTKWFFYENNVFHRITTENSPIIPAGAYAIIADSIPDFMNDHPGYSGLIFNSSFSLNNTGEPLAMANPEREIINAFTYSSEMGAKGDGNSLQINNGLAISASPTPGVPNKTESEVPADTSNGTSSGSSSSSSGSSSSSNTSSSNSTHAEQVTLSTHTIPVPFKVGAGRPRTVPARTPLDFTAESSKTEGALRYSWSFGDMSIATGKKVQHVYEYPGIYNVVLTVSEGTHQAVTRTQITVTEPQIQVIQDISKIELTNTSSQEINIGNFRLQYIDSSFTIPQNTIISPNQTITITRKPHQILQYFTYWDGTIYSMVEYSHILVSSYLYCVENSYLRECKTQYIAKIFDIIKGWLV